MSNLSDRKIWQWAGDHQKFEEILVCSTNRSDAMFAVERCLERILGVAMGEKFMVRSDISDHLAALRGSTVLGIAAEELSEGEIGDGPAQEAWHKLGGDGLGRLGCAVILHAPVDRWLEIFKGQRTIVRAAGWSQSARLSR